MKQIRTVTCKWYFIIPISLLILTTGCRKEGNIPISQKEVSGEEIYKSVFFGDNKIATKLSNYSINMSQYATTNDEKIALQQFENEMVASLEKSKPGFFEDFKQRIQHGNLSEIEAAVRYATKLTEGIVSKKVNLSEITPKEKSDLVKQFKKDDGFSMKPKDVKTLMKQERYQKMFAQSYSPKAELSTQDASLHKDVAVETAFFVYLYVAGVVAFAILIFADNGTVTDGVSEGARGQSQNVLFNQQMIVAIADQFGDN